MIFSHFSITSSPCLYNTQYSVLRTCTYIHTYNTQKCTDYRHNFFRLAQGLHAIAHPRTSPRNPCMPLSFCDNPLAQRSVVVLRTYGVPLYCTSIAGFPGSEAALCSIISADTALPAFLVNIFKLYVRMKQDSSLLLSIELIVSSFYDGYFIPSGHCLTVTADPLEGV